MRQVWQDSGKRSADTGGAARARGRAQNSGDAQEAWAIARCSTEPISNRVAVRRALTLERPSEIVPANLAAAAEPRRTNTEHLAEQQLDKHWTEA